MTIIFLKKYLLEREKKHEPGEAGEGERGNLKKTPCAEPGAQHRA